MNHMVFPYELVFQKSSVPTFNAENEHGMQNDRVYNDNFINVIQSFFCNVIGKMNMIWKIIGYRLKNKNNINAIQSLFFSIP